MPKVECPKCGAEAECSSYEVGDTGGHEVFILVCGNCGYIDRKIEGCSSSDFDDSGIPQCPFCGKTSTHKDTPKKYR